MRSDRFILSIVVLILIIPALAQLAICQTSTPGSEADVKLYYRNSILTPARPMNNSTEQTVTLRSAMIEIPSDKRSLMMNQNSTMDGEIMISLWVKKLEGDTKGDFNATIKINLLCNNGNRQSYYTNNQVVTKTPVLFIAKGTYHQEFRSGDTFDVQLIWHGHSRNGIGPTPSGEFVFGNEKYDSNIQVPISPHPLSITKILVGGINAKNLTIKADFTDFLNADPSSMVCSLSISNFTHSLRASHVEGPSFSNGSDGSSSVTWTWDYKKDKAPSGVYNITIDISYNGTNRTSMGEDLQIDIPQDRGTGGYISYPTRQGYVFLTAIIAIVADLSIISFFYKRNKRK